MSGPDRYAVMGDPIEHSKSPLIHSLFARQTAQNLVYSAIRVPLARLEQALLRFCEAGGRGLNMTVPLKLAAARLVAKRSARAEAAGAVNTIVIGSDGALVGDNSDGVGLLRDLHNNHGVALRGRRILLLGAGGASRGVLGPLIEASPHSIVIANRTVARAAQLAARFAGHVRVEASSYGELAGQRFDVIINGTAAGLRDEVPPVPAGVLTAPGTCYDMMYADAPTAFVRWARAQGAARALDGLGMLVEQAAESFFIWRGVRPQTGPVIGALRPQ